MKKTIKYIINTRMPTEKAYGYQVSKMCEEFSKLDFFKVQLYFPDRENKITEDLFSFYGINDNFEAIKVRSFDWIRLEKYLGKISYWLQTFNFICNILKLNFKKDSIIYTRSLEIAVVYNLLKYKVVVELHTIPDSKRKIFINLLKKIKFIIVLNEYMKQELLEAGIDESRLLVAGDAVDLEKFDMVLSKKKARDILSLHLDNKIILYTGHLYPWKGVDCLLKAMYELYEDCILYIVGGDIEDYKALTSKYRELVVNNRIKLITHRKHSEIPIWLKAADVLVLPNSAKMNISKFYTSPLKLFEYMASGRSIVASDLPSIREVLDESFAYFARPDDVASLVMTLKLALKDTDKGVDRSGNSINRVNSWNNRAEKITNFLFCKG